ncbi:transposase family protein, partial [Nonomuraea sp. NPDC004702]
GSVHDLSAARAQVLAALYAAATRGLPALADSGYDGAGVGIHTPSRRPEGNHILSPDNRTHNRLPRALRRLSERGFALLKGRWRTLQHITVSPSRIGDNARAASTRPAHLPLRRRPARSAANRAQLALAGSCRPGR